MPGKVLVVEDDDTMQEVLKYNLTKDGYSVLTAGDGMQALEIARTKRPDLILLDINLPLRRFIWLHRTYIPLP